MASQARVQQPPWQPPPNADGKSIHIYNSLTRSKTPFAPLDPQGKKVTWYVCGPTVYDDAHVGHARNYVSTDVIRRIMRDYFQFDVKFVMNITDVDDKIIIRARQHYLFDELIDPNRRRGTTTVQETSIAAFRAYLSKNLKSIPHDVSAEELPAQIEKYCGDVLVGKALEEGKISKDDEDKTKMRIKTAQAAADGIALLEASPDAVEDEAFLGKVKDVIMPYLDSLYGSTFDASDHSIFTKWAKKYEDRFMEDMQSLNVLEPDVVTRVTEYVEKITAFITQIEQRGFAYKTSDNSVFFDIKAFEQGKNSYARLEPWSRNNMDLQADGEGALTKKTSEKKSDADFALWKSSKQGEPSWQSPWGLGRPGWHIECSAMASQELGAQMDIHSGGIDLAFPHHDNELAQSEAYWRDEHGGAEHQWVNYFMHMGHLDVQGAKMSKSLKNFVTIRHELSREGGLNARSMRILFMLGGWKERFEVTEGLKKEASAWEDKVNNFFIKVLSLDETKVVNGHESNSNASVQTYLAEAKGKFHSALTDSFNTSLAIQTISELITKYNSLEASTIPFEQSRMVALWITQMVNMFGLNGTAKVDSDTIGWSGIDIPAFARPYLTLVSSIRDRLRQQAQKKESIDVEDVADIRQTISDSPLAESTETAPYQKVLEDVLAMVSQLTGSKQSTGSIMGVADRIRDENLWDLGVYLEDRADSPTARIRPVTKELREAKDAQQAKKAKKSLADRSRTTTTTTPAGRDDKRTISPQELFKNEEYSAWDDDGLPLKDNEGNELTNSKRKKLKKQWDHQKRLHDQWQSQHQQAQHP
ncbi:cysteinyl-tRNA synthetase [Xanthoria calcicola]